MNLEPGDCLGPYEVLGKVGAGGMGEVYLGRDTRLGRPVAIKVLSITLGADTNFRDRFNREARIIAELDHPNICPLYDVGEKDGLAFLVMQFLEGESLFERINRAPVDLSEAIRITLALASALDYAHRRGVLHRDVKPRNVMLLTDGTVKLLDFGVAKKTLPTEIDTLDTTAAGLTQSGSVIGTLQYMSPERLAGDTIDARSDIFSLGLILYELAAGRHPFEAATPLLTANAILSTACPPLEGAGLDNGRLNAVVQKALAREPSDRYATMADFAAGIRSLDDEPVVRRQERTESRLTRRAAVALITVVAGLVIGGAAVARRSFRESTSGSAVPSPGEHSVTYWLDVQSRSADGADTPRAFRSVGQEVFQTGSRFRLNVVASSPGHLYVFSDATSPAQDSSGLTMLFPVGNASLTASSNITTGWYVLDGPPMKEALWMVWTTDPIPQLTQLASLVNPQDLGRIRDATVAASLRSLVGSAPAAVVSINRQSPEATLKVPANQHMVVHRLELEHG